jgi:hypothetical protein
MTSQVIINFGKWVVNKDPKKQATIHTAIDKKGKEYVTKVDFPMLLVQTGKQVIHMKKEAIKDLNVKLLAQELNLLYISHQIVN